jgi:hypothetical protein
LTPAVEAQCKPNQIFIDGQTADTGLCDSVRSVGNGKTGSILGFTDGEDSSDSEKFSDIKLKMDREVTDVKNSPYTLLKTEVAADSFPHTSSGWGQNLQWLKLKTMMVVNVSRLSLLMNSQMTLLLFLCARLLVPMEDRTCSLTTSSRQRRSAPLPG